MNIGVDFKKNIIAVSQALSRDIQQKWPDFSLQFILFRRGGFQDDCERLLSRLKGHACESAATNLLRTPSETSDASSFLGIATGSEKSLFGLKSKRFFVGFAAINLDSYKTKEDCLLDLYHLSAQALDTFNLIEQKQLNIKGRDVVLLPKRNQLGLSRSNLRSDIFSALMMQKGGVETAIKDLAVSRGKKALMPQSLYRPEDYPFAISMDVMEYSAEKLIRAEKPQSLPGMFGLSSKIATSFDKHNLKSWIDFATPAQTMAWNGFTPEQILATAVYTSTDPFIKATGNLISEITGISADKDNIVTNSSNPYLDESANKMNHARMTEEVFDLAIMHAVESESHLPLIQIANDQNEALLKGRVLGWCADALQSAARTFEVTLKKGLPPAPASRIEFQRLASNSNWDGLNSLSSYMVAQRRAGHAVTFSEITDWCAKRADLKPVMESIQLTMADPDYSQRLAAANEVPMPFNPPSATPAAMPNYVPAYGMGHAPGLGSSMGGGMMGSTLPPQRQSQTPVFQDEEE